jgi:hypothetical protein
LFFWFGLDLQAHKLGEMIEIKAVNTRANRRLQQTPIEAPFPTRAGVFLMDSAQRRGSMPD